LRLKGQWGLTDVYDSISAIRSLGQAGLIDPKRAVIKGGSAGGFTSLAALSREPDAFAAGAPSYGIADLRTLQAVAHKFEGHLLEQLMGGRTDEVPDVWADRSPITRADKIRSPLLVSRSQSRC
jgi:dipeptidyl aminopeptidase/acylaminoacyl peptidase